MGRPTTKTDLLTAAANNYEKLNILVSGLTEKELSHKYLGFLFCQRYSKSL